LTCFTFDVTAYLDAEPTGSPDKCQAARRPTPPLNAPMFSV